MNDFFLSSFSLITSSFIVSTPLLLAAMGGLVSERAGIVNIALEGTMLMGALMGAIIALQFHSPWIGFLGGGLAGMAITFLYSLVVIKFEANQIVAGTAINLFAMGLAPFISKILFDSTGSTPNLDISDRFSLAPAIVSWMVIFGLWGWLKYTASGLWLSFAGEHPKALQAAGVSVIKTRWLAMSLSGFLTGLAGASLSLLLSSSFTRNMTAGRGFMALAALILGKWKPLPTALACLLFGITDALQTRLQGLIIWGTEPVPVQFIQILPYLFTLIVLAGFVGGAKPPKALGQKF